MQSAPGAQQMFNKCLLLLLLFQLNYSFVWHWTQLTLSHRTLAKEQDRDIPKSYLQKTKHVKAQRLVGEGSAWASRGALSDRSEFLVSVYFLHLEIQSTNCPLPSDLLTLFSQHPSPGVGIKPCSSGRVSWAHQKTGSMGQAGAFVGSFLGFPTHRVFLMNSLCSIPSSLVSEFQASPPCFITVLSPPLNSRHWNLFREVSQCRRKGNAKGCEWVKSLWWVEIIKEDCHFPEP